jgi:hypothetical protein
MHTGTPPPGWAAAFRRATVAEVEAEFDGADEEGY